MDRETPGRETAPIYYLRRLPLGTIVATLGALRALTDAGETAATLLSRHERGDWGDLCAEDRDANRRALVLGYRLLSNYPLSTGARIWIITEADRSVTTLLLPSEY